MDLSCKHFLVCFLGLLCAACSSAETTFDVEKLPKNEFDYNKLAEFAHQTIPEDDWSSFCDAPREEIDAKITLIGYDKGWDQDAFDKIKKAELSRIYNTQKKYAPKPIFIAEDLKTDAARGKAIRDLEAYDQFWASAVFRYSEFTESVPSESQAVFGALFNRGQCEEQIYVLNTLKPILESSAFPTDEVFGEGTLRSLFLITQHADDDIDFQTNMLEIFQSRTGAIRPSSLALLTDRVKVNQGALQIYGSQLQCIDGSYQPKPVINPETLDERRASVGLGPFETYAARTPGCGNGTTF